MDFGPTLQYTEWIIESDNICRLACSCHCSLIRVNKLQPHAPEAWAHIQWITPARLSALWICVPAWRTQNPLFTQRQVFQWIHLENLCRQLKANWSSVLYAVPPLVAEVSPDVSYSHRNLDIFPCLEYEALAQESRLVSTHKIPGQIHKIYECQIRVQVTSSIFVDSNDTYMYPSQLGDFYFTPERMWCSRGQFVWVLVLIALQRM